MTVPESQSVGSETHQNSLQRHFRWCARNHRWACRSLLSACRELPEADYRKDSGLFFRSVHGTLCHLIGAELLWEARLTGGAPWEPTSSLYNEALPPSGSGQSQTAAQWEALEPDLRSVEQALEASCERWIALAEQWDDATLLAPVTYLSTDGDEISCVRAAGLTQVFTHAAHHRGQITAAFTGMGRHFPPLDLQCQGEVFFKYDYECALSDRDIADRSA